MKKYFYCFEDTGRSGYAGGQRITDYFIDNCQKKDSTILFTVFDRGYNKKLEEILLSRRVRYFSLSKGKRYMPLILWVAFCIKQALTFKNKFNVIYTPNRSSSFVFGLFFSIFPKQKNIWVIHDHMVGKTNNLLINIYNHFAKKSDCRIFSSSYCRSFYKIKELGLKTEIFGGIVANDIPDINDKDIYFEKILKKNKDFVEDSGGSVISVLYVGRINKEKGIFDLVEIWKNEYQSFKGNPSIYLYICGTGRFQEISELKKLIPKNGNIFYLGEINVSKRFYSLFDIGIVPSWEYRESLGLTAFEMAFHIKKVLISSKGNVFKELFKIKGINKLSKKNISKQIKELYSLKIRSNQLNNKYFLNEKIVIDNLIGKLKSKKDL